MLYVEPWAQFYNIIVSLLIGGSVRSHIHGYWCSMPKRKGLKIAASPSFFF